MYMLVLYLHVTELRETFAAVIKTTDKGLVFLMRLLVSSHVPPLCKLLVALGALEGLLLDVSTLVRLVKLAKSIHRQCVLTLRFPA